MYEEEEYLMLSGIQHYIFCKRQWALIHIEQQWEDNYSTTSGNLMHKRAHNEKLFEKRGDIIIARGLRISSQVLGMTGQCDVVEFHRDEKGITLNDYPGVWRIVPVEYKNGIPKEGDEDVFQLCAQAICLEEMFQGSVDKGYLYYGTDKRRLEIDITENMKQQTKEISKEMHEAFKIGLTPKGKKTKRCNACSLKEMCVLKLEKKKSVKTYLDQMLVMDEME